MSAGVLNISIEQGALFELIVTIKDPLDVPINLTGYAFEGQVRLSVSQATPDAVFEAEVLDAVNGRVRFFILAEDTAVIPIENETAADRTPVDFLYDLSYGPIGGDKYRLLQGVATVSPEVTR